MGDESGGRGKERLLLVLLSPLSLPQPPTPPVSVTPLTPAAPIGVRPSMAFCLHHDPAAAMRPKRREMVGRGDEGGRIEEEEGGDDTGKRGRG